MDLERTLDTVAGYGYDGLKLPLLDGEPIDPSAVDGATRRILVRTQAAAQLPAELTFLVDIALGRRRAGG